MIGDDLTPFFVAGEFCHGEDTLDGVSVVGQFDASYVRNGGGMGMSDAVQAYLLPTISAPAEANNQRLVHKGITYQVAEVEPDGTGLTVLVLENI